MDDLKPIIAGNITYLRKKMNITQAELAQKLNYSDKAVSKWERAESLPDIATLKEISKYFGVSVDYLIEGTHNNELTSIEQAAKIKQHNRMIISMLSAALVFLICTILFVTLGLFAVEDIKNLSLIYLYAIPVACIVLLVFNSIWGKRIVNFVLISILMWSLLLSIYFTFSYNKLWLIFLLGIPAQIIIFLWANLKTHETLKKYGDELVSKHTEKRLKRKKDRENDA